MGSSSKKPKQQVADYLLSLHVGVCYEADSIERIRVQDKVAWKGHFETNGTLSINQPNLFGGNKKEGGLRGLVEVLLGGQDQVLPGRLITKLGRGLAGTPGFRGITSLFFTGGGPEGAAGFMWGSNSPYLKPIDVTVRRSPKGFYPTKAWVPETVGSYDPILITHTQFGFSDWLGSPDGRKVRIKSVSSSGFVVEGGGDERSFNTNVELTSIGPPTDYPTPSWTSVTAPSGYLFAGWISTTKVLFTKAPDVGFADAEPAILVRNVTTGLTGRFDADLPGDEKLIGVGMCQSTGQVMVFARTGPVSVFTNGPGYWYLLNSSGGRIAQGPVGFEVSTYSFGFGNYSARHHSGCSLEPNGKVLWRAYGAGDNPIYWYTIDSTGTFTEGGRVSALSAGGAFIYPTVWALDGGCYAVSGGINGGVVTYDPVAVAVIRDKTIYDYANTNPAHIIYECLTNTDWGLGLSPAMLDNDSFIAAADTLYDEALGLSMMWSSQTSIEAFINDVLNHIEATYGIDPQTGKIYLSLVRGGYSTDDLHVLNPDNCKITRFQRKALSETFNEVVVTWTNPANEQEETVTVHDLANYAAQGVLNSSAVNYYGVRSAELATRLALRNLASGAAPLASFEADVDRTAWSFKPGDIVKLTYPEYGISELPVRVTSVNYGRPGASKVQVSMAEDVFSTPVSAYVDVESSLEEEAVEPPEPLSYFQGGSAPYYFVSREIGTEEALAGDPTESYVMLMGASAEQINSIDVATPVTDALGNTTFEYQFNVIPSGHALLASSLAPEALSTGVLISGFTGSVTPEVGVFAWIGSGIPVQSELVLISGAGVGLTIMRGVLDTSPREWPIGTQVWFIGTADITDPETRLVGGTSQYKLMPRSVGGILDMEASLVTNVTADARQHLPYRPANVSINGAYWPAETEAPLTVNFARRNRVTEEPVVQNWTGGDVTPEAGQTVTLSLRRADTNALLDEVTGIAGTTGTLNSDYFGPVTLSATSVRDGLSSFQPFTHTFSLITRRVTEAGEERVTEDGQPRMLEYQDD